MVNPFKAGAPQLETPGVSGGAWTEPLAEPAKKGGTPEALKALRDLIVPSLLFEDEVEWKELVHMPEGFIEDLPSVVLPGKSDFRIIMLGGLGTSNRTLAPVGAALHEAFGRHTEVHALWDYDGSKENLLNASPDNVLERFQRKIEELPSDHDPDTERPVTIGVCYSTGGYYGSLEQALNNTFDMLIMVGVPLHLQTRSHEVLLDKGVAIERLALQLNESSLVDKIVSPELKESAANVLRAIGSVYFEGPTEPHNPDWDNESLNGTPHFKTHPIRSTMNFNIARQAAYQELIAGNVSVYMRVYQGDQDQYCTDASLHSLLALNTFDDEAFQEKLEAHIDERLETEEEISLPYVPGCGGGVVEGSPHAIWFGREGQKFLDELREDIEVALPILAPHISLTNEAQSPSDISEDIVPVEEFVRWWRVSDLYSKLILPLLRRSA